MSAHVNTSIFQKCVTIRAVSVSVPFGHHSGRLQSSGFPMVPMSLSSVKRNLAIELMQATESSAPAPWHPRLLRSHTLGWVKILMHG